MAGDLKNLGKKGWLSNLTQPKKPRVEQQDPNVVTRYAAVPLQDIDDLKGLVERDPENLELKDMLAFSLYSQERLEEAVAIFKDLLNRRHRPGTQRLYLGNCFYKRKLFHLAVKEWEWVAKDEDADPAVREKCRERIEKVRAGQAIEFGQGH